MHTYHCLLRVTHVGGVVAGIFLNYMATKALMQNRECGMTFFKVGISIFFYVSYAILFGNFFYWTYLHKKGTTKVDDVASKTSGITKVTANGHVANGIPNAKATVTNGNGVSSYNLRSRKN